MWLGSNGSALEPLAIAADATAWLSQRVIKPVMFAPVAIGDFIGNVVGLDALHQEYVQRLGSVEAADAALAQFVVERQSSSNQAIKPQIQRDWGRKYGLGAVFTFQGEQIAKFGQLGESFVKAQQGDITYGQALQDVAGISASMAGYIAVQAGLLATLTAALTGDKLSDEEEEAIYDNVASEVVGQAFGWIPLANIVANPIAQQILLDRSYGIQIPALSELTKQTNNLLNGKEEQAVIAMLAAIGVGTGLPNAITSAQGVGRMMSGNKRERKAGSYQAFGRTESTANRMVGIRKPRERNTIRNKVKELLD